jgi:hypothetical protein
LNREEVLYTLPPEARSGLHENKMATSTTSAHAETITPGMRDRQARGKDPYSLDGDGPYDMGNEDGDFVWEQGQRVRYVTLVFSSSLLSPLTAVLRG